MSEHNLQWPHIYLFYIKATVHWCLVSCDWLLKEKGTNTQNKAIIIYLLFWFKYIILQLFLMPSDHIFILYLFQIFVSNSPEHNIKLNIK